MHDVDEARRDPIAELRERLQVAGLDSSTIFALDRRRRSRTAASPSPRERAARPETADSRIRVGGAAVGERGETRRRRRARGGRREARSVAASSSFRGSLAAIARDDMPMLVVCLPTYNERENLERMVRALGDVFARARARRARARDRRRLARTEPASSPTALAARASVRRRAPPAGEGGARPRLPRRLPARARGRRRPRRSRWTATSPTTRPTCRGSSPRAARRRRRARLALRRRRRHAQLGRSGAARSAGSARLYAQVAPRSSRPRPDRRVQVLPPARRSRRSTSTRVSSKGYAFQIETDLPGHPGRLPRRRGPDRLHRPRGRRLEDERRDRRSRRSGRCPALRARGAHVAAS